MKKLPLAKKRQKIISALQVFNDVIPPKPLPDQLGRRAFAAAFSYIVESTFKNPGCTVLALEGSWGAGKTYTINLIEEELKKSTPKAIKIVRFNPWYFNDRKHLASLLLSSLSLELSPPPSRRHKLRFWLSRQMLRVKWLKPIIKAAIEHGWAANIPFWVTSISAVLTSLALPGALGDVLTFISLGCIAVIIFLLNFITDHKDALGLLASVMEEYSDANRDQDPKKLEKLKEEVSKLLESKSFKYHRLIIVLEDLDRLTPEEIRITLQTVRMVADFPKTTYLLAYDRDQVIRALSRLAGDRATDVEAHSFGRGFLQKVVHGAYELPKLSRHGGINLVLERSSELMETIYGDLSNDSYYSGTGGNIALLINNVREAERVLNRAQIMFLLLGERSNATDVLFSAYLMEIHPQAWEWLAMNMSSAIQGTLFKEDQQKITRVDTTLGVVLKGGTLEQQFPSDFKFFQQIKEIFEDVFPGEAKHKASQLRNKYRICTEEHFESYFKYAVTPAADLQELVPELLSSEARKRTQALVKLRDYRRADDQLYVLFQELKSQAQKANWRTTILPLLEKLGELFDNIPSPEGALTFPPAHRVFYLAHSLISNSAKEKRADKCIELINAWASTDSKYLAFWLAETLGIWSKFVTPVVGMKTVDFGTTLTRRQFDGVLEKMRSNINSWVNNDQDFLKHPLAASMLFMWLRLDPDNARAQIDKWLSDEYGLLRVLNTLISESYSIGSDGTKRQRKLPQYALEGITGKSLQQIQKRVKAVAQKNRHAAKDFAEVIDLVEGIGSEDELED